MANPGSLRGGANPRGGGGFGVIFVENCIKMKNPFSDHCDRIENCSDGSDEKDCGKFMKTKGWQY